MKTKIKCKECKREMEISSDTKMVVCKCGYTNEAPYLIISEKLSSIEMKGGIKKDG